MFRSTSSSDRSPRLGYWCCLAAVAACLGLSGCTTLDYSDYDLSQAGGLSQDIPSHWSRDLRPPESGNEFFGVSNRARQVERDFGIR